MADHMRTELVSDALQMALARRRELSTVLTVVGHNVATNLAQEAMRMLWATRYECTQAIPPIYAEFIGNFLLSAVNDRRRLTANDAADRAASAERRL